MADPITWTVEQIKLGELVEWDKNPVTLSEHDAEEIRKSIQKFGLAIPLVANAPCKDGRRRLIDGHQRDHVMVAAGIWEKDTLVNVSVPSRILTEKECDELSIRLRKNTGDWDMDALANGFDVSDLMDWGFTEDELVGVDYQHPKLHESVQEIRPLPMLRVLISFPVDSALDAKPLIDKLAGIQGVEVLYGANDEKEGENAPQN
jgi:hypothetical protein